MKRRPTAIAVLGLMFVMIAAAAPRLAGAETVNGKKYSVFIYSRYVPEPAATITFKAGGVLLISSHTGFGGYAAFAEGVIAVFSAPEYEVNKDLFMIMTGLVLDDFLSGVGITFTNGAFSEIFFFSGYETAG
jgi:hypothetical protein